MALTPEEQARLQQIDAELAQADREYRQQLMNTPEVQADAARMSNVGNEGILESALIGAGRSFVNTGRAINQLTMNPQELAASQQQVDEERQLMSKIGSPIAATVGELGTDIGTLVLPGTGATKLFGQLGKVSSVVNRLNQAANATTKAAGKFVGFGAPSATKLGRAAQYIGQTSTIGGLGGAATGAITPMGTGETKLGQIASGGAYGALLGAPASALVGKAIIPGAMALGRQVSKGVSRILGDAPQTSPVSRILSKHLKDSGITTQDLAYAKSVADDFKLKGMEDLTPPIGTIVRSEVLGGRFADMSVSKKNNEILQMRNDEVNRRMTALGGELNDVLKLSEGMTNSELLERIPAAAMTARQEAKGLAQQASRHFYEQAAQDRVAVDAVSNYMKSPIVQRTIKEMDSIPELKQTMNEIKEAVFLAEPAEIKQARALLQSQSDEYSKILKKSPQTLKENEQQFINDYNEARTLVQDQDKLLSVPYLDLVSRRLRERAKELRTKNVQEGGSDLIASKAEQTAEEFNQFLTQSSPALQEARNAYAQNLEQYMTLERQGLFKLATMSKGSIRNTIKTMTNADPEDFSNIVSVLNKQEQGLGDEIGKIWLTDKLEEAARTDKSVLRNLSLFFAKEDRLKKARTVIQDKEARKLFDKIALVVKYYTRPLDSKQSGGLFGLPISSFQSQEILTKLWNNVQGVFNRRNIKYLLDSSKWGAEATQLLNGASIDLKTPTGISTLTKILSLISGSAAAQQ